MVLKFVRQVKKVAEEHSFEQMKDFPKILIQLLDLQTIIYLLGFIKYRMLEKLVKWGFLITSSF